MCSPGDGDWPFLVASDANTRWAAVTSATTTRCRLGIIKRAPPPSRWISHIPVGSCPDREIGGVSSAARRMTWQTLTPPSGPWGNIATLTVGIAAIRPARVWFVTAPDGPAPTRRCFKDTPDDLFTPQPFDGHGFSIHRRRSIESSEVAIFIHGFRGEGYATWGDSPNNFGRMLFYADERAPLDIGMFRYSTGMVAAATRARHLDRAAERLAQAIQELSTIYKSIYFISHSLNRPAARDTRVASQ